MIDSASNKISEALAMCMLEVKIKEFLCNIQCTYCDIGRAGSKRATLVKRNKFDNILENIKEYISSLNKAFDFPLVKLIGGEVLMLPDFIKFVKGIAPDFETVVITTNGTLLNKQKIQEIGCIGNVILQISLDGHTFEMNQHRFTKPKQLQNILDNLDFIVQQGIRVEINCVVASTNSKYLLDFTKYLSRYGGQVTLQPFPVRWRPKETWYTENDADYVQMLINQHHLYPNILPPRSYLVLISDFLKLSGRRSLPCYLPMIYVGLMDNGSLRQCSCLPRSEFNLKDTVHNELPQKWRERIIDTQILSNKRLSGLCNTCLDQFDILTLAITGNISTEELIMIPSYSGEKFIQNLDRARKAYLTLKPN